MDNLLVISSDSHVFELPDLWTERIDAKFRDRTPRMQRVGEEVLSEIPEGVPIQEQASIVGRGRGVALRVRCRESGGTHRLKFVAGGKMDFRRVGLRVKRR